jgi:flavin-dependent dehydrogenase
MSDYQVVIIGGRPAGSSLAIRLGRQNIKTLVVDKMTFPSLPAVPSSPILYSHHLSMLEELGISESDALHAGGRVENFVINFVNHFHTVMPMSAGGAKHPYAFGADRVKMDAKFWETAGSYESVTTRSGFSVTGVIKENGKVVGIKGQTERGSEEIITADLVVGADGRFSRAAQEFDAATLEEHNEHIATSYHAEWENVADGVVPNCIALNTTGKGFGVVVIPIDTRKYIIGTYMRPEHHRTDLRVEEAYIEGVKSIPAVWDRLKNAKRVTQVVGVKGIKNGIRQPYGNGWALVGDAFHYKDPLDGQGIYDAMVEAKALSEEIVLWLSGDKTWEQAGQSYGERAIAATKPMMLQTVGRVKKEMFTDPPAPVIKTLIRWTLNSPEYQRDFIRLITRSSDPANWMTPGVTRRAVLNGIKNDFLSLFRRRKIEAPLTVAEQPG